MYIISDHLGSVLVFENKRDIETLVDQAQRLMEDPKDQYYLLSVPRKEIVDRDEVDALLAKMKELRT